MGDQRKKRKQPAGKWKFLSGVFFTPATVFVLSLLSVGMLLWFDRINERQRMNFDLCDALMDIQIKATSYHLWLEEAITGDTAVDIRKVWDEIDLAISLSEAILNGGKSEHGVILQPLKDSSLRKRMEDLKPLLTQIKKIGLQRIREPEVAGIGSAIDQRFDAVFKEFQDKAGALEMITEKSQLRDQSRSKRLFWVILLSWVSIVVGATAGLWGGEVKRRRAEEALAKVKDQLEIKVKDRTGELGKVNDQLHLELNEHRKTEEELRNSEKQLRSLSSQLLTAQERERRRIAAELHDELGSSLALLRIEFALLEKKLNEDQTELRERCRRNLEYIEQVADNVSRLSRNLSPYLLEDLGLPSALRSLLSNFGKHLNVRVTHDIPEMDHLFSEDAEITIYRIIQESLTNIGKHAQARHVSMVIHIDDDSVCFTVEDDGKGYKVEQALNKDPDERGMGLSTMSERVRILGGSFDLWSQEGQGSRISFRLPKKDGGMFS